MNAEDISRIGVIGAGLMGHGIALNFALGGFDVYLNDTTDESLEKALENIDVSLDSMKSVGLADEAGAEGHELGREILLVEDTYQHLSRGDSGRR